VNLTRSPFVVCTYPLKSFAPDSFVFNHAQTVS
jgi:hypothetical protein